MAMTLNLTLVIQVAHFLIAYMLLSRFLFRPGYEFLKADENRLQQLKTLIVVEQEKLAEKQEYKRKRWQHCQNYFSLNRPQIEREMLGLRSTQSIEQLPTFTQKEIEEAATTISRTIREQVLRD